MTLIVLFKYTNSKRFCLQRTYKTCRVWHHDFHYIRWPPRILFPTPFRPLSKDLETIIYDAHPARFVMKRKSLSPLSRRGGEKMSNRLSGRRSRDWGCTHTIFISIYLLITRVTWVTYYIYVYMINGVRVTGNNRKRT